MHSNFHLKFHWREDYDETISVESYVRYMYEDAGYKVYRLQSNIRKAESVRKQIPKFLWNHVKHARGIPDFLVIDRKNKSFFFLEVKLSEEGLNRRQIKWIVEHSNLSTAVLFVFDPMRDKRSERLAKEECKDFKLSIENPTTAEYILESLKHSAQ